MVIVMLIDCPTVVLIRHISSMKGKITKSRVSLFQVCLIFEKTTANGS